MKTMFRAVAPLLILIVVGCSTSSDPRLARIERLTSFCNTYAATLNQLSTMKEAGELSSGQIQEIDRAEAVVTPACLIEDPNNISDELLDAALDGIAVLNAMMEN